MSLMEMPESLANRVFGGYFARCSETSLKVMFGCSAQKVVSGLFSCAETRFLWPGSRRIQVKKVWLRNRPATH